MPACKCTSGPVGGTLPPEKTLSSGASFQLVHRTVLPVGPSPSFALPGAVPGLSDLVSQEQSPQKSAHGPAHAEDVSSGRITAVATDKGVRDERRPPAAKENGHH